MDSSTTTGPVPTQPTPKNVKNLSIRDFFTSKLMRTRSFEANASSPRDETSSWFDEFKARMTKKSQAALGKPINFINNNQTDEGDEPTTQNRNDATCQPLLTSKIDNTSDLVRNKSDIDSGRKIKQRKNAQPDGDQYDSKRRSQDEASLFELDVKSVGLRERTTTQDL